VFPWNGQVLVRLLGPLGVLVAPADESRGAGR
jgi:hypothetical protein